jgi:hypothetical protein
MPCVTVQLGSFLLSAQIHLSGSLQDSAAYWSVGLYNLLTYAINSLN